MEYCCVYLKFNFEKTLKTLKTMVYLHCILVQKIYMFSKEVLLNASAADDG